MEQTNETIIERLNDDGITLNFMGTVKSSKLVQEQTMHQVFKVNSDKGNFYVKIGKPGDKDQGAREMKVETDWYRRFKHDFKIPYAPDAIYTKLDGGVHVMAVQEVLGETYDKILRKDLRFENQLSVLEELMHISAEVSERGYNAFLADKENTPAFFGEFDEGECNFLVGRTLKILKAFLDEKAGDKIQALEKTLKEDISPLLVDEEFRSFYRDAIPLNWIKSEINNKPVPIDLGSTSYRPVQFDLVALIETPKCGLDNLTEEQRDYLVEQRWKIDQEEKVSKELFDKIFQMTSFLKNCSGVASRIQHIKDNKTKIELGVDIKMYQNRLKNNLEGRDFHIARALAANNKLLQRNYVGVPELEITKEFLQDLSQGKYI